MFSKYKVNYNPSHSQPLLCPVYTLSHPLDSDHPLDKWKEKITPGIYLLMSPIHAETVSFVLSLSIVSVSPHFHVVSDPSFAAINGRGVNFVLPSYWKAMYGFVKENKLVFVHSEQYDPSTTFISPLDQYLTDSKNSLEPEEHSAVPVQEYDTQKSPMLQPASEQQPSVHPSFP